MKSKENDYQLRQGNKIYVFSTSIIENGVRLSCKNQVGKKYSRDFTIYDINIIDQIFSQITSEEEAIKFIDKALNVYKVGVSEESGIIKIIFYIQTKGLLRPVEIQLGESGKSLLQSKIDNLNIDNTLASTAQIGETNQPIEFVSQAYENQNFSSMNLNSYGQQSFYIQPINIPIEGEISSNSNYNIDQYLSQYQINGNIGFYEGGTKYDTGSGFIGENVENIGSYHFIQNDTSNASLDFGGTNNLEVQYLPTKTMSTDQYNSNSYEYISNQYSSSDNNYYPTNYATYQGTSTSYENNSYNYPTSYIDNTNQFLQSGFEGTEFNEQQYQTYENTESVTSLNNNGLQTISPDEQMEKNNNSQNSQYKTNTAPDVTSALHLPLNKGNNILYETNTSNTNIASNSQPIQDINSKTAVATKLANNKDITKNLKQQIIKSTMQSNIVTRQNELQTPEKKGEYHKNSINESEIKKLKEQAAEAVVLKEQLARLEPLKKQVEEMGELKKQVLELNSIREKLVELKSAPSQLEELKQLRQQVGQMNILRKQLDELNTLRTQAAMTESLKKRVEELEKIIHEYEQEIKELREFRDSQKSSGINASKSMNKGYESKQITFDEKTEPIRPKGEIIHDTNELEMIIRKINKLNKKLSLNLLYKASVDTDRAVVFHEKCDDAKSTIVLVETDKGKRFGGYTSRSWNGDCVEKKDEDAFVFSLDKMKTYDNIPEEDAIGCYPKFGPIFLGCQIRIYDECFSKGGTTFEKALNYETEEDYELNGGERTFNVKEIEVYEVILE